mgnify:CR=1 FL=1
MGTLLGSRSDFGAKPTQNAEYIHFQYKFDAAKCLQSVPNRPFSIRGTSSTHRCTTLHRRIYHEHQRSRTVRHAGRPAITPRRRRGQHTYGTPATLRLVRRRPQTRHRRNTQGSHPHQRHLESHHRRRTHGLSRNHRLTDSTEPEHLFALIQPLRPLRDVYVGGPGSEE